MTNNADRIPALIAELTDVVARVTQEHLGIPTTDAQKLGWQVARTFCREFQGQVVYIPLGTLIDIDERDRAMYAWYCANGRDPTATAREFNLGIQQVYRRIKMVETINYARQQMPLFQDENDAP